MELWTKEGIHSLKKTSSERSMVVKDLEQNSCISNFLGHAPQIILLNSSFIIPSGPAAFLFSIFKTVTIPSHPISWDRSFITQSYLHDVIIIHSATMKLDLLLSCYSTHNLINHHEVDLNLHVKDWSENSSATLIQNGLRNYSGTLI